MIKFSYVIIILCAIFKIIESYEQFDESAWMENYGQDKYFEYPDSYKTYDEKVQVQETTIKVRHFKIIVDSRASLKFLFQSQPVRRHLKNQDWNIVDILLNTVNRFVRPTRKYEKNETSQGLDVQFDIPNVDVIPSFGNNQDLQLIYLGTKWCGSGDIANDKKDVGYFYLTGLIEIKY